MSNGARPTITGAARLELVDGIALLHPEDAVFEAMLSGFAKQQRGGRRLQKRTVEGRDGQLRRFAKFTNEYPWNWTASHMDEWMVSLISEKGLAHSTLRSYQLTVRLFCDFLISPAYEWATECEKRFGTHPVQICHEWNTIQHLTDYEGQGQRRPFTRDELQKFLDYCDDRIDVAARSRRKGTLAAYRDATLFKVLYGWGLRRNEGCKLDLVDFHRNAAAPELGRYGMLQVRWGKATKGSPPRRRNVASVMPWAVEAVEDYVVNVRPRFGTPDHPALWLTERGGRLQPREVNDRFTAYRDAIGLPPELTPHSLRHSHVTHQIEDGVDPKFVQDQVGHRYASTTAIYTAVSGDFMNTMMRKALDRAFERDADMGDTG
ncbi:site-specific recombinase XerD [Streptomyces sp. Ag82_O1-15]|uniref:tyrosine-type recombinase/integrase n=1 Tax=Streptomyces sp. Ag82_O1-15 TaxID=1938855 RepID=UPI000BB0D974|nr:tyrosine-type recombinase/integrase [Streptomyces sp. Ag82_O1-15]PBD02391.1 site-specific recombinase XerD [Streptomyces sp. Ag82_O1-15]